MRKDYLLEYMPDYYKDVYEMKELLKAQSGVLSEFEDTEIRTLLNEFVMKADETGISIFENQYNIRPEPGESLESRRRNVLLQMLPPQPITLNYLRNLFKLLDIPLKLNVAYAERFLILNSNNAKITDKEIRKIQYISNVYLPANMIYELRVYLGNFKLNEQVKVGFGQSLKSDLTVDAETINLKDEFTNNADVHFMAGVLVMSSTIIEAERRY